MTLRPRDSNCGVNERATLDRSTAGLGLSFKVCKYDYLGE